MSSSGSLRALAVETTADETTVVLPPSSVPGASSSRSKNLRDGNMSFRKSPDSWRLSADAFDTHKKTAEEFQGLRSRKAKSGVMAYYRKQNALVDQFGEIETLIAATDATGAPILASDEDAAEKTRGDAKREKREEFALQISFWANVLLLGIKTYAAVVSGSLSIMTSALDSFLDLVSGLILYLTERNMKKSNKYMYPAGKSRMQPLGIIVFSCIMGTLGFQIMIEGVRQLVGETHTHHLEDLWAVLGIMVSVIVVKFCLYLFCRNSQNEAVLTYAQDHRNDVMTNSVGLAAAIAGDKLYFWIDPLGAILLASYIGAFYTLVPIRPRLRGERRSLRTLLPGASLRPGSLAFNPDTPRRLSTPSDAFQPHPDVASRGTTLSVQLVVHGAGERQSHGGGQRAAGVSHAADVPRVEPPRGHRVHRHRARVHFRPELFRRGGRRVAGGDAVAKGARHRRELAE